MAKTVGIRICIVLMVGKRVSPTSERELLRDVLVDRFGGYVHALGGYVSEYHGVEVSEPGAASGVRGQVASRRN